MTQLNEIFTKVKDLAAFTTIPHQVVQSGLAQAMESMNAKELEKKLAPVRKRLAKTLKSVQKEFVARDDAVEAIIASLMSGVPAVLLGPPGTAKSAIIRELARRCGLGPHQHGEGEEAQGYFEYLLTSHTMPEELFGAPDLKVLTDESVFQRNTQGMLPTAQFAFLDEVFRGGSHILNTLLSLLNEKIFHDGRSLIHVPLVGVVGASNEVPADPDLAAFFDRFPIRVWLDSIFDSDRPQDSDAALIDSLLTASAKHEMSNLKTSYSGGQVDSSQQISCMNDFRCARAMITLQQHEELTNGRKGGAAAARTNEFLDLFKTLFKSCGLSDRSLFSLKRFAQTMSWLTEDPKSQARKTAHFKVFRYLARNSQERRRLEMDVHDALQRSGHSGVE